MTTYVIGDVQGCLGKLDELITQLYAAAVKPHLIFVGDLVNRGPDSLQTLRRIRALGPDARVVLGNHDLHLLAVTQGIRLQHRGDTLHEVLDAPDRDELMDWLRHQSLAIHEQGHLIVHAGVAPQWTLPQTLHLAAEVEAMLRGPDWVDFLRHMYGNAPARWDDGLQGHDRLRCIVNALTRIRYCHADGSMDMVHKDGQPLEGLMPWFDMPGRRTREVPVVIGHWSTLGLVLRPDLIALDTGCLWGGKLTAVCLEDRSVVQVDCPQYQVPGSI
ncbi:Bis(5'nucleosyl)-tetraphosphatase, ApaH [Noviherbaspirillum humi]|uniref:bis(5'-nucleosyl)-tetraphosphatase (symmetrical) n=1 Tax=Noviherbaspirillum humi TaxID=1688639 RepID=A0A239CUR3_9BURK|nr:symmetrical bis(5'-nucleosyl)-tetraphosphatase [Noviherbaspirillum humi]SNS23391.1 Bis(5'nucleosyl)-tetraphosphatase, ApaH [Noviherbaspirillum humi]